MEVQAHVKHYDEDIRVLADTLERLRFDGFSFEVDATNHSLETYLHISGESRDPRDFDWALEHILSALDAIGWSVDRTQANPELGSAKIYFTGAETANPNTIRAQREFSGGDRQ